MQIIDACTLCSFSAVGRMALLRHHYGDEARWTQAIQWETASLGVPSDDTAWLGPALDVDDIEFTVQVHRYRRLLGARPGDRSTLHLGEAEAPCYIEKYQPNWVFISDEQSAVDFAVRRGLQAIDTPMVLTECYENGEIGCPQAYGVLCAMSHAGRGVRLPPDHWHVCPPA
jgi:hypothetical protein